VSYNLNPEKLIWGTEIKFKTEIIKTKNTTSNHHQMVLLSKAFIENWRHYKEITYLNVSIKVSTVKYYK